MDTREGIKSNYMIKANELRIGNAISWKDGWDGIHYGNVHALMRDMAAIGPKEVTGQGFMLYRGLEPIEIKPDLLEECGFEYLAWEGFLQFTHMIKNGIILRISDYGCGVFNYSKCDQNVRQHIASVKSLHQLQNLYFALTEEELTILVPSSNG